VNGNVKTRHAQKPKEKLTAFSEEEAKNKRFNFYSDLRKNKSICKFIEKVP
jgi:hypothetical protein